MARNKKTDTAHLELAEALEIWGKKFSVTGNPYLSGVVSALREKEELHKWSELNPFNLLPFPVAHRTDGIVKKIDLITNIRNVLVFAPVALTWAAVGQATQGFEKYVGQNGATVVNFLEFWQNGYGVLPSFWRIADVARLDFIIIAIVIALTITTSVLGRRANKTESLEVIQIENERTLLAIRLALYLIDKKKITNFTFNQSMAGAIQRLQNATSALEKTSKELLKSTKKLPKTD